MFLKDREAVVPREFPGNPRSCDSTDSIFSYVHPHTAWCRARMEVLDHDCVLLPPALSRGQRLLVDYLFSESVSHSVLSNSL